MSFCHEMNCAQTTSFVSAWVFINVTQKDGSVFLGLEVAKDGHKMRSDLKHFLLSLKNLRGPDHC